MPVMFRNRWSIFFLHQAYDCPPSPSSLGTPTSGMITISSSSVINLFVSEIPSPSQKHYRSGDITRRIMLQKVMPVQVISSFQPKDTSKSGPIFISTWLSKHFFFTYFMSCLYLFFFSFSFYFIIFMFIYMCIHCLCHLPLSPPSSLNKICCILLLSKRKHRR
jgi:hypothetical protein